MAFPGIEARVEEIKQKLGKHDLSAGDLEILARSQATGEALVKTRAPFDGELAKEATRLGSVAIDSGAIERLVDADNKLRNG